MSLDTLAIVSSIAIYAISPLIIVAVGLAAVRLVTTWNYYRVLQKFDDATPTGQKIVQPAIIPYSIPWLGHTLSFLSNSPGQFWAKLFSWHPRSTGICTLVIGGRKTHILYSPNAVQALFRAKTPARDVFDSDLFNKVFLMSPEQIRNANEGKHFEHEMNAKYLTSFEKVNELTAHFTNVLEDVLTKDVDDVAKDVIGLYSWLRDRMFTASVTALLGSKLLEIYPNYCEDFYNFDSDFLSFFFQLPKFMMKDAIANRARMFAKLKEWNREAHRLSDGTPVDPDGPAWEPLLGSRLNRARQLDYKNRRLNSDSAAGLDAGITFALSSNAIPATGWMLFNLLNPSALRDALPRALAEVKEAERSDGSLDVAKLVSQPLLQSLWTETLRCYTDVLVTRNLPEDLTLPLDQDGKRIVILRKGDNVFAPSWLGHHDASSWSTSLSPQEVFDAERFLVKDPQTGRITFSMSKLQGKFLPFGGGKTICPGRTFAKQEALGALALILLRFDFDFKGFVDVNQKPTESFPQFLPAFPGSGALAPGGDIQVKIRRRKW